MRNHLQWVAVLVSEAADPPPITIPPPGPVRLAGVLVGLEAVGLLVLAALNLISGLRHHSAVGQLLAQIAYFVVLALFLAAIAAALLKGRRWGRTPAIVVQILTAAIGIWLAFPSSPPAWGIGLIVLAVVFGALLFGRAGTAWINEFPSLFGPEPDR
jgi:hypothetical protein